MTAAWEDAEFDIRYELGLENAVNAPSNPDSYTIGGGNVLIENPSAEGCGSKGSGKSPAQGH